MTIDYRLANFSLPSDRQSLCQLMQEYARDPMGGGEPLSADVLEQLPSVLRDYPGAFSVLACSREEAVGLINCFETLSTFKAKPLINIHDVIVTDTHRNQGIAVAMLQLVESEARRRGCCKLTLEVLEGNHRAGEIYKQFGFSSYQLDQLFGSALFLEKVLSLEP